MAGAFVAQGDDPATVFYNVGGLAFVRATEVSVGTVFLRTGDVTSRRFDSTSAVEDGGRQAAGLAFPPHVFVVHPLGYDKALGLGLYAPYGLASEWEDPDAWAGRFLAEHFALSTIDLSIAAGWRPTPRLGLGVGVVARFSSLEFVRRSAPAESGAGERLLDSESRLDAPAYGWSVGFLHRPSDRLSWGGSYRDNVESRFSDDAEVTMAGSDVPLASLPFEVRLEFPSELRLGVAVAVNAGLTAELAVDRVDWRSFDRVDITMGSEFETTLFEGWDLAYTYRLGLRFGQRVGGEWLLGYSWAETPQPEPDVGPVIVDSDLQTFTFGYATNGARRSAQLAIGFQLPEDRTARGHRDGFEATYGKQGSWLVALTMQF